MLNSAPAPHGHAPRLHPAAATFAQDHEESDDVLLRDAACGAATVDHVLQFVLVAGTRQGRLQGNRLLRIER